MSRLFNGTTQFARVASAAATAAPVSFHAWAWPTASATGVVLELGKSTGGVGTSDFFGLLLRPTGVVRAAATHGATNGLSDTGNLYTLNAWNAFGALFTSTTSRLVYCNGTAGTLDTTSVTPTGIDTTTIGCRKQILTDNNFFPGRVAEAAIWNVALSAGEWTALAKRVSPLRIRPANLIGYWPCFGVGSPEPNDGLAGSVYNLTLTNTPTLANHVGVSPAFGFDLGGGGY